MMIDRSDGLSLHYGDDGEVMTMMNGCNEIPKRVSKLLQQAKSLQNAGSTLSSRLRIEEQSLSQRALSLEKDIKRVRADVFSNLETGEISPQLAEKVCRIDGIKMFQPFEDFRKPLIQFSFFGCNSWEYSFFGCISWTSPCHVAF